MTVCGKVICFFFLNSSNVRGTPVFLKIQTILALNVWQKSALNFPKNRFSRSPAFNVVFRKAYNNLTTLKIGKGGTFIIFMTFAKIKCQDYSFDWFIDWYVCL